MAPSPVVLFVYNRIIHTEKTITALKNNFHAEKSDLIIFSDGAKHDKDIDAVNQVRHYIQNIQGFKSVSVIERDRNYGLASSIIDGVTQVCNQYGKVIVLEDDIVTSRYFLTYMNDALDHYELNKKVASIHGYVYPIDGLPETFFLRGADCWGWATWADRWQTFEPNGEKLLKELISKQLSKRFDFNGAYSFSKMLEDQIKGLNNSWAVRWHATAFLNNQYTLYPGKSLVENIGNDGSGSHCGSTDFFLTGISDKEVTTFPSQVEDNQLALSLFERYFRSQNNRSKSFKQLIQSIKRKLMSWV